MFNDENEQREHLEELIGYLDVDYAPAPERTKLNVSPKQARHILRKCTGVDFGFNKSKWRRWLNAMSNVELETQLIRVFINAMARGGLPLFRWFSRPVSIEQVESQSPGFVAGICWGRAEQELRPDDEIWPFLYPRHRWKIYRWGEQRTWGLRGGYIILNRGQPVGIYVNFHS